MHLYAHEIYNNNISAHLTRDHAAVMISGSLVSETPHRCGQSGNEPSDVGQIVRALKPLRISNSIMLQFFANFSRQTGGSTLQHV